MIVNWLMLLGQVIVDGFMGLVPDGKVPPQIVNLDDQVSGLMTTISGVGVWVNFPVCAVIIAIPMALWASGFAFKIGLWAWSKIPVIGGR